MDPGSLLMLVIIMVIFYFVLVRPQKKRMKEHAALLAALTPGDEVVTTGGIYGFINRVEDDTVYLEVSEDTEMRLTKQSVIRRVESGAVDDQDLPEELQNATEASKPDGSLPPSP